MHVGEEIKFTGIVRDITDRKRSEATIKSIVETAADGIIVIDSLGCIEQFNAAAERLFGLTSQQALGQNVKVLMPISDREHHEHLKNFLQSGVKEIIGSGREVMGKRGDGSLFPMELTVSEMKIGEVTKFTGIIRDITERKQAQELAIQHAELKAKQAESANKAKSKFLATMRFIKDTLACTDTCIVAMKFEPQ
jgi:PAS domain S-box-containing protein